MTSKVLVVEDNPLNMKLFKDLLETKDIKVICVSDGRKVIRECFRYIPNLILMDIRLKDISGIDLIKELKRTPALLGIPIIALTAFAMKSDQQKILSTGCEGYISKPIVIDSFFKTIAKFIKLEEMA